MQTPARFFTAKVWTIYRIIASSNYSPENREGVDFLMQRELPRLYRLRYPLVALALILLLLAIHRHFFMNRSSPTTGKRFQTVTITNAGFLPNQLKYHEGETISWMIVNADSSPHNLVIEDLMVFSASLKPNESAALQFVAAKKGRFAFVSNRFGTPETGYRGLLIVE
jgi:plastocyanin